MSLTSYRAALPRDWSVPERLVFGTGLGLDRFEMGWSLVRFGGDLLSHVLRRSTIGVTALNGRVRDGIGCLAVAMTTKPDQRPGAFGAPNISVVPSAVGYVRFLRARGVVPCRFWIRSSQSSN